MFSYSLTFNFIIKYILFFYSLLSHYFIILSFSSIYQFSINCINVCMCLNLYLCVEYTFCILCMHTRLCIYFSNFICSCLLEIFPFYYLYLSLITSPPRVIIEEHTKKMKPTLPERYRAVSHKNQTRSEIIPLINTLHVLPICFFFKPFFFTLVIFFFFLFFF